MNDELKQAIQGSNVLSDEQKQGLLDSLKNPTSSQIKEITKLIVGAEKEYQLIIRKGEAQKKQINLTYLKKLNDFATHGIQKKIHEFEDDDRKEEPSTANTVLDSLNQI